MLGQRLDATRDKIIEIADRMQGNDAKRLKTLAKTMRKIAVRWANLYHNEREQLAQEIKKLGKDIQELGRTNNRLKNEQ